MEFDEIENFMAVEREKRKTDRERELEKKLAEIHQTYRRVIEEECAPIYRELAEIEARKPPMPVVIDGKIFEYVGLR